MKHLALLSLLSLLIACGGTTDSEIDTDTESKTKTITTEEVEEKTTQERREELQGMCPIFSNTGPGYERFEIWNADTLHQNNLTMCWIHSRGVIDEKYGVFKNLRLLEIRDADTIGGLEMFPKLNALTVLGGTGKKTKMDANAPWLKQLGYLRISSTVTDFETFKNLENLKSLNITYGQFLPFPEDFDQLKNLGSFRMEEAYGEADFSEIDFSKNKNLTYVSVNSGLKGVPKNLNRTRIRTFDFRCPDCSSEQYDLIRLVSNDSTFNYPERD